MSKLAGKVTVVAGATRGAARGIARALGEEGATVYCTGRSIAGQPSPYKRSETIDETAELVTAAGGTGIAVRVDHTVEAEVQQLFARVDKEHGRLDVLVDAVAGMDPRFGQWGSFWEADLSAATDLLQNALVSHLITVKHGARLMIRQKSGLIVEVTEGELLGCGGNILASLVKPACTLLACRMAEELHPHGVAAMAVVPGFLRSEVMLEHFGVTVDNWRDAGKKDPHFLHSETPLFIGRAIAALAADADVFARSGELASSWELAREYGFADEDGGRPDWGKHFASIAGDIPIIKDGLPRTIEFHERILARAREYRG